MNAKRTIGGMAGGMMALMLAGAARAQGTHAQGRPATTSAKATAAIDWSVVDSVLGRPGAEQPGGVRRYGFPRTDLQVTVRGVAVKPALALGSWLAFEPIGANEAMVMGDLVLTEDEVEPVMRALQQGGIEQTALHNHLLGEVPRVMYMHVGGHGAPRALAAALRSALRESRTPMDAPAAPPAAGAAPAIDLDTAAVARALGAHGKVNGGVYQVSVPRRETIREGTHVVPPSMGVATALNFQPTGGGRAAVTGDFVLRGSEVSAVARALRGGGIDVTAIHSHLVDEQPRLYFMHFWAEDDATRLAGALRTALDRTASRR